MAMQLYGQVLWCEECAERTPHGKVDGGSWICGYCGAASLPPLVLAKAA